MARARKVVEIFTLEGRGFLRAAAIINIHNPELETSVERAARRPHAVTKNRSVHAQKDRPSRKRGKKKKEKKLREGREKKRGRRGNEKKKKEEEQKELGRETERRRKEEEEEDEGPARGAARMTNRGSSGHGPWGPNRKRGKSTGKYVVDSAERRPKAKWNSVR